MRHEVVFRARRGFTLLEMLMVILLVALVLGASISAVRTVLLTFAGQDRRAGMKIRLDAVVEKMTNELREARDATFVNPHEIRFTYDNTTFFIYYFYHPLDGYPSAFTRSVYEVRKATVDTTIDGVFTYGSGSIIARDVAPPPVSSFTVDGTVNVITIDLSAVGGDETIRSRVALFPRNV